MSARAFAVFIAVLAGIGLLAYGVLSKGTPSLAAGETVPDKPLPKLDGAGTASLDQYRGRWVLVNVWASYCPPCRDEAPTLESFYKRFGGKRFTVLGVDYKDNTEDGLGFVKRYGLTYPQVRDIDGDYAQGELGTTGYPESFHVDPSGRLVVHVPGPVTEKYLETSVRPLITGKARQ